MDNTTRLLIVADLNQGLSLKEINRSIKAIEHHKSLKAINLKVNIDKNLMSALNNLNSSLSKLSKSFSGVSDTNNKMASASQQSVSGLNKETQAINQQTDAINKNVEATKKIIDPKTNEPSKIITTYGNDQNNNKKIVSTLGDNKTVTGNIVETTNQKKDLADYNKMLNEAYRMNADYNKKTEALDRDHYNALKTNKQKIEAMDKQHYLALKQNAQRDLDFQTKTQAARDKIENARLKFGHNKGVNESLDRALVDVNGIKNIGNYDNSLKNINSTIGKTTAGLKAVRNETISFGDAMKTALQKFPIWMLATTAFYAPLRGLQASIDTILEVDKQITELKRVMDEDTNFDNLLQGSIDLSKELGRSITDVNEALTGFARQGFNESEILELTKSATLAQNISDLKAEESMDALTAAMVVFNIEASESIGIIDSLNEVDNNMAVTSRDLAIAMQKSASAASTFGVSMEELIGDSATIMEITRESGAIAGNSLKTIYSRLTTMQPAINALSDIGINIHDSNGELKTATTILDEVAVAFKGVNDETKQNTAVALAGRYQLSRFLALVNNRNIAHEATAYALNSEGSAMRENEAYMESYEAKINLMKTAWQEFSLVMGDALIGNAIVAITGTLTGVANAVTSVVDTFGVLPPLLGSVALAAALVSKNFRATTISVLTLGKGIKTLGISANTAKVALRSLGAATVVGVAFVALGFILEGLMGSWAGATEKQKEYYDNLKNNLEETKSQISSLDTISKKLDDSNTTLEDRNSLYKDLAEIVPDIIDHYTAEGEAVYKQSSAVKELVAEERERLRIKKELAAQATLDELSLDTKDIKESQKEIEKLNSMRNQATADTEAGRFSRDFLIDNPDLGDVDLNDFSPDNLKNIENYSAKLEELKDGIRDIYEEFGADQKRLIGEFSLNGEGSLNELFNLDINLNNYENALNDLNQKTNEASDKYKNAVHSYKTVFKELISTTLDSKSIEDPNIANFLSNISNSIVETNDFAESNGKDLVTKVNRMIDELSTSVEDNKIDIANMIETGNFEEAIKKFPNYESEIKEFAKQLNRVPAEAKAYVVLDDAGLEVARFASRIDYLNSGINVLEDSMDVSTDGIVTFTMAQELASSTTEDFAKIIDSTISELSEINGVLDKVSKGQSLNGTEVDKLIRAYPELRNSIIQTADGYSIEESALHLVRDAKLDLLEKTQLSEAGINAAVYSGIESRLKNYEVELDAIQSLADARNAAFKIFDNNPNKDIEGYLPKDTEIYDTRNLYKIGQIRENFNKLYANPSFGVSDSKGSKSSSSAAKDLAKLKDATDAQIDAINKLAEAQATLNDQISQRVDILSNFGEYDEALIKTNTLYGSQRKEIELLTGANKDLLAERNKLQANNKNYDMSKWIDENGNTTESFLKLYNSMKSGSSQESLQALFDKYQKYTEAIVKNNSTIVGSYEDIKDTIDLTLKYIQLASDTATSKFDRQISLLGNINTQEEKDKLVQYSEEISNALRKESGRIFSEISKLNKIINDPKSNSYLKDVAKQSLKVYRDAANEANLELIAQAETLGQQQAEAIVFGFNKEIEDLEYNKSLLGDSDEDLAKAKIIDTKIKKIRLDGQAKFNTQILELEKKLSTDLNAEERMRTQTKLELLQDEQKAYTLSLVDILKKETDERETAADKIIENYKKMLEQQRDLELDAIDKLKKAEDERHKEKMDRYDKELDAFNKIINAQLNAMNRLNESEDHERELQKLLDEEGTIQTQVNTAKLDDSFEGKKRLKDLQEKLVAIQEEIEAKQRDRGRTLQQEALEDQLSDREDYIGELKKSEDKKHEDNTKALDKEREITERHWKSILEDEKKFYTLKQNLMSDDEILVRSTLNGLRGEYNIFFDVLRSQAEELGEMFATLNSNFKIDYDNLKMPSTDESIKPNNPSSTPKNPSSDDSRNVEAKSAWKEYLSNKQKAEAMGNNKGAEFDKLAQRNEILRNKFKFQDGSFSELSLSPNPIFSAESGGMTAAWGKQGKFALLHEKEIVLKKSDTSNLLKIVDVTRSIIDSVRNFDISKIFSKSQGTSGNSTGTVIENLEVNLNGTNIRDGGSLADELVDGLNRKGIRVGR